MAVFKRKEKLNGKKSKSQAEKYFKPVWIS